MADRPGRVKGGATPGKLTLIGVLAVVLVAVLYIQFGGSDSAADARARKPRPARPAGAGRAAAVNADDKKPRAETKEDAARRPVDDAAWKLPDLTTVIAHDPFALPSRFPQARPQDSTLVANAEAKTAKQDADTAARTLEQMNQRLEEMRQLGVKVILKQKDHYVALVGDQTIHVGDEINGFTVTEITPSGVRVERKIEE